MARPLSFNQMTPLLPPYPPVPASFLFCSVKKEVLLGPRRPVQEELSQAHTSQERKTPLGNSPASRDMTPGRQTQQEGKGPRLKAMLGVRLQVV